MYIAKVFKDSGVTQKYEKGCRYYGFAGSLYKVPKISEPIIVPAA